MSYLQIRVDKTLKENSKKILDKLGIDMSTAVRIYLKQIVNRKGLPFLALTENHFTVEQEDEILRISKEAKKGKNVSMPMNGEDAIVFLKNL